MSDFTIQVTPVADIKVSVLEPPALEVNVVEPPAIELTVSTLGERGLKGDKGDSGETGGSFVFQQNTPSCIWTMAHNLGFYPSVSVVDSSGSVVSGDLRYIDINTVEATFNNAFSGRAYFS